MDLCFDASINKAIGLHMGHAMMNIFICVYKIREGIGAEGRNRDKGQNDGEGTRESERNGR